jgi:hypothetical protein
MPPDEQNPLADVTNKISKWRELFISIKKRFGTPLALTLVIFVMIVVSWWKWPDLQNKPGVEWVTEWLIEVGEYFMPSKRVNEFTIQPASPPRDSTRFWTRVGRRWEEKTPNGEVMYHWFVNRMSLDGCKGDQTKKDEDNNLEMFVPDKGCKDMTLHYRYNKGTWFKFGSMFDIR